MKIFVKPKAGLKVPNPYNGRALSAEGEVVEKNTYWARRAKDGDVVVTEVAAPKSKEEKGGK